MVRMSPPARGCVAGQCTTEINGDTLVQLARRPKVWQLRRTAGGRLRRWLLKRKTGRNRRNRRKNRPATAAPPAKTQRRKNLPRREARENLPRRKRLPRRGLRRRSQRKRSQSSGKA